MKNTPIAIVAETDEYVVINKPALVDSQNSKEARSSVVDWLQEKYDFSGLVHRLDFGTSGLMVCAKNPVSAKKLTTLLQDGKIKRTYWAIAFGKGLAHSGTFDFSLDGQEAITRYKVLKNFANAMLVELELVTGRKHQVRRHFLEAGFPLIGDHLYKKRGSDKLFDRPALHAKELVIAGTKYQIDPPADFQSLLARMERVTAGG